MNLVLVAILGPLAVAIGAVVQIHVTGSQRRADKREDWARQDEVARRVDEAAALLVVNNDTVATMARETSGQLQVIHTLVNSTLTGAKQATLEALHGQLILLERFTPGDTDLIDAARASVAELRAELSDRITQTAIADSQSKEATS